MHDKPTNESFGRVADGTVIMSITGWTRVAATLSTCPVDAMTRMASGTARGLLHRLPAPR